MREQDEREESRGRANEEGKRESLRERRGDSEKEREKERWGATYSTQNGVNEI